MKKKLVIFGAGDIAQIAHLYFSTDSDWDIAAFTVDADHLTQKEFCGLPVVPFEEVVSVYSPADHAMFAALSYNRMNGLRREKYEAGKALGYEFASYISSRASILNEGRLRTR